MRETLVIVGFAIVADPLLRRIRKLWRKRRISRTVAGLKRGEAVRIRCDVRFRNSGGKRHRARLAVKAEGVFLSTIDGTVSNLQLRTPGTTVEIVAELSMMVCNVAGRQLEVLLPTGEDRLLKAVAGSLIDCTDEQPLTTCGIIEDS
ncbi:hypothetical protein [Streptomyces sp. NPDC005408]|uniref:hypothetical protein n=1 Tax=Streptomyces sp. NPDC005408 TaxID=3155341 RepID=UPI0033B7E970